MELIIEMNYEQEQEHSFQKISDDKKKIDLTDLSSLDNNSFLSENYFNEFLNLI